MVAPHTTYAHVNLHFMIPIYFTQIRNKKRNERALRGLSHLDFFAPETLSVHRFIVDAITSTNIKNSRPRSKI